jgi:hypothetical protein
LWKVREYKFTNYFLTSNFMSEFKYKEQHGVIVICKDQEEQQRVYEQLLAQGFNLKIVVV